jgi:hypothetical protein
MPLFGWWAWPSWLGHLVVAQEVVGSSPIAHPIHFSDLHFPYHPVSFSMDLFRWTALMFPVISVLEFFQETSYNP